MTMTRAYNSQASSRSVFGMGWSHDYDIELLNICENNSQEFNHVVLKDGNGSIFHFTRESGQSKFVSSLGSYVNLICETEEKSKTVHVSGGGEDNAVTVKYKFVLTTKGWTFVSLQQRRTAGADGRRKRQVRPLRTRCQERDFCPAW
ncbi:MAG: DUF6531 domain-containing protein [Clostridia bacterium]